HSGVDDPGDPGGLRRARAARQRRGAGGGAASAARRSRELSGAGPSGPRALPGALQLHRGPRRSLSDRRASDRHGAMKILVVSRPFVFHGGVERATAGFLQALANNGHDVHLLSPPGQQPLYGVTRHTLRLPPVPGIARVLVLPLAVRLAVRRRAWDVVQSHERTLSQDVYRAGEGCHRAYLEALPR